MDASRLRGVTRRLLAVLVAVLAVTLCLGAMSLPSWAEEPAASQGEVNASSQVEESVDAVHPDSASGPDADILQPDGAADITDMSAPEPGADEAASGTTAAADPGERPLSGA